MKYTGFIILVIGLALMGLSYYTTHRVNQETSTAYETTSELSNNPLTELGGSAAEGTTKEIGSVANAQIANKASSYEKMAAYEHTLGLILIVLGAVIALFYIVRKYFS